MFDMKSKISNLDKFMYWFPRIFLIIFILFISVFALDVFSERYTFLEMVVALFMHLIPSFVLALILYISWRNERVGGIIFILIGVFFGFFFDAFEEWISFLLLCVPLFLIGGIFLLNYHFGITYEKLRRK